jgi:polyhydroxybutyrate depolymerase
MPLVVNFHGAGSNMNEQSVYSGFDPVSDKFGFVVATPNGIEAAIRQWRFLGTDDDITFAREVVADLVDHACVDASRAFATGISSGAAMSTRLACSASDTFRGFGLVAADFYNEALCGGANAGAMAIFHGTEDKIVPYGGGEVNAGGASNGLSVAPAEESAAGWAAQHNCAGAPTESQTSEHIVRLEWSGCDAPVVLYRVVGGGHTWPGAAIPVAALGPTTDEINATELMWELFAAS